MKKTLIIGNFGIIENKLDGQTVKTLNIYRLLKEIDGNTVIYNTELKSIKSLLALGIKCLSVRRIVIVPAHNSLKYLFPIVYLISVIKRIPIYYIVIGGWLVEFIENKRIIKCFLKRIQCVFSETNLMKQKLERKGFKNVSFLPNFRYFSGDSLSDISSNPYNKHWQLKLVFLSRVQALKGVDILLDVMSELYKSYKDSIVLHFYGQIDEQYRYVFNSKLKKAKNCKYCGVLQPKDIQKELSRYDILVLPTRYYTEGLPGAIIDAYSSGIPVLVTKWKHAEEFVYHKKTGIIIPFDTPYNSIKNSITFLFKNREVLEDLKKGANKESYYYSKEYAKKILLEYFK